MKRLALPAWIILACLGLSFPGCPQGWFGSSCQYKCRCADQKCEAFGGNCLDGVKCMPGWFGPACQYVDLAQTATSSVSVITDGIEDTCVSANGTTLKLTAPLQLSWFRVHVKDSYYVNKLNIQFKQQSNSSLLACENKRTALVSDTALDIHCHLAVAVTDVILTGETVPLCSFYISGGRNVALKQNTTQSSLYDRRSHAFKAVDGDRSVHFENGDCTHTKNFDPKPTWNVTLSHPASVNRYVVYNRDEGTHVDERLQGFILTSYDPAGAQVFRFVDTAPTEQAIYTVTSPPREVQTVSIRAVKNRTIDHILLTLCEVEIYGDSSCNARGWGRECEHDCRCAAGEQCFVSTGGCPSGCAAGFQGENCRTQCDPGKYGAGCVNTCSEHCVNTSGVERLCEHVNGTCLNGCKAGYNEPQCTLQCDPGKYGAGCVNTCSEHCINTSGKERLCEHVNGTCLNGCKAGYKEPQCTLQCDPGKYGSGCVNNCSEHCVNTSEVARLCEHVNGTCLNGCEAGYKKPQCTLLDESPAATVNGQLIGVIVGVVCAIVLAIFAGVIISSRRRKWALRKTKPDSSPALSSDNLSCARNDVSEVRQSTSENEYEIPRAPVASAQGALQMSSEDNVIYANTIVDDDLAHVYQEMIDNTHCEYVNHGVHGGNAKVVFGQEFP